MNTSTQILPRRRAAPVRVAAPENTTFDIRGLGQDAMMQSSFSLWVHGSA